MRCSPALLAATAVVALAGCGAATSTAPPTARISLAAATSGGSATVTTSGTGTVSGTPDVMTAQIGVENTGAHVAAALNANNATSGAVQASLERQGVAAADIQTAELSLYAQQGRTGVTGYHVSDVVTATIRDLPKAGAILDAALGAAGDAGRLDGVSFSLAGTNPGLAQARQRAVAVARSDADQLAAADGLRVIGLRSLSDQGGDGGQTTYATSAGSAASLSPVPIQAGTQETTVQVTAVWAVGR